MSVGVGVSGALLVATRSAGKLRELIPMIEAVGLRAVALDAAGITQVAEEDAIECYETFEENALAKARWFSARAGGATLVLSDDSGLCVDALGGAPGVRSRRWAAVPGLEGRALDDANNAKLVRELAGVANRSARYVCVAAIIGPGIELKARGECVGHIMDDPRGANGFGYDPWFFSDELGEGFGEASIAVKERVSHRGRAMRAVLAALAEIVQRRAQDSPRQ